MSKSLISSVAPGLVCTRRLERQPDDPDPAEPLGQPSDAVLAAVEHRHDHDLVDHVPGVDQAGEVGDVAPDPGELHVDDRLDRQIQQPVRP